MCYTVLLELISKIGPLELRGARRQRAPLGVQWTEFWVVTLGWDLHFDTFSQVK